MMTDAAPRRPVRTARGFTRRTIDPDLSVGATLVAARQQRGVVRSAVAVRLGIPERYLEALEAEDLGVLPGFVYEKHFLQRYAAVLQLDARPLVDGWAILRRGSVVGASQFVPRVSWWDLWVSPFVWRRAALTGVLVAVTVYLGVRFTAMVQPPALALTSPLAGAATADRSVTVQGATEPESAVTVNGQPVPTQADGSFQVAVALPPGPSTVVVAAAKRYGRPATVERQVFVAVPSTPAALTTD